MANTTLNQEDLIEIQRLSDVKKLKVLHIKNSKFGNIVFPNSISNARQMLWHISKNTMEIPLCPVCNSTLGWHPDKREYRKYCGKRCSAIGSRDIASKTSIERYGMSHYSQTNEFKERIKVTSIENFGVEHYSQTTEFKDRTINKNKENFGVSYPAQSPIILEKMKNTTKERHGEEHYSQTDEFKNKFKNSSLKKYGTDHPFKNSKIREKITKTNLEKYGTESATQNPVVKKKIIDSRKNNYYESDILNKLNDAQWLKNEQETKTITQIANELGVSSSNLGKYFSNHNIEIKRIHTNTSDAETEIVNFIKDLGINVVQNNYNIIPPKEIDIFLPDENIAIEYNGIYWHSELQGKEKSYHLDKTIKCENKNIQLMHIFDYEWGDPIKKQIWKSMIKSKLGFTKSIYARKCKVKKVSIAHAREFMEENHLDGFVGGNYKYGLYYEDILVQCIIISKSRFNKNADYELIRLATKKDITVVGGISKLLSNTELSGKLITYANRRYSLGKSYQSVSMSQQSPTPPNYFYITKNASTIESRQKYQKHKIKDILPIFDEALTEWENMKNNGYDRFWDCGNLVFTFELKCAKIEKKD